MCYKYYIIHIIFNAESCNIEYIHYTVLQAMLCYVILNINIIWNYRHFYAYLERHVS